MISLRGDTRILGAPTSGVMSWQPAESIAGQFQELTRDRRLKANAETEEMWRDGMSAATTLIQQLAAIQPTGGESDEKVTFNTRSISGLIEWTLDSRTAVAYLSLAADVRQIVEAFVNRQLKLLLDQSGRLIVFALMK